MRDIGLTTPASAPLVPPSEDSQIETTWNTKFARSGVENVPRCRGTPQACCLSKCLFSNSNVGIRYMCSECLNVIEALPYIESRYWFAPSKLYGLER